MILDLSSSNTNYSLVFHQLFIGYTLIEERFMYGFNGTIRGEVFELL